MPLKRIGNTLFFIIIMFGSIQSIVAAGEIDELINLKEQLITSMKAGDTIMINTKYKEIRRVERGLKLAGPAGIKMQKGIKKFKKSRSAYGKGDTAEAIKLAEESIALQKEALDLLNR